MDAEIDTEPLLALAGIAGWTLLACMLHSGRGWLEKAAGLATLFGLCLFLVIAVLEVNNPDLPLSPSSPLGLLFVILPYALIGGRIYCLIRWRRLRRIFGDTSHDTP